jgi:hypothetical protein
VSQIPELKTASEIAAGLQGRDVSEPDPTEDPKGQVEYTFQFRHTDPRGRVWAGSFTNRILNIRQRNQVKVIKAQLSGNTPISALDSDAWMTNEMIAHLAVSLTKKPEWARELQDLFDDAIVEKLYAEVVSHEATFSRRESDQSSSETAHADGDR